MSVRTYGLDKNIMRTLSRPKQKTNDSKRQKSDQMISTPLHPWEYSVVRRLRQLSKRHMGKAFVIIEITENSATLRDATKTEKML